MSEPWSLSSSPRSHSRPLLAPSPNPGNQSARSTSARSLAGAQWYDEFAIGWNELFDDRLKLPSPQPSFGEEASEERREVWQLPPEAASGSAPQRRRRGRRAQQAAVDQGMKDKLVACSIHQLRKPADVMEGELKQLRGQLLHAEKKQREEARRRRRLMRKCRVKDNEDLEELEVHYLTEVAAELPPDPADVTPRATPRAKDFFAALGRGVASNRVPLTAR